MAEEFNEDCSEDLHDLSQTSLQPSSDQEFAYTNADINKLSVCLGIRWQTSKSIPFSMEVPYLGFCWDMRTQLVHLPDRKKANIRWPLWNGKPNAHTTSLKHSSTASFFTQLWSSQPDAHTLQTWRPCLPPLITVLSFCMGLPEIPLTIWPGGSTSLGTQTSSSPSQGPNPSLSTEHIQMPVLALVWLSQ